MKTIMFFTIAAVSINLCVRAQGTSHVAERFRLFAISLGAPGTIKASTTFNGPVSTFASDQPETNDEMALRALITTMETGWNNKSGAVFSSVFADVHDYIVVNGMYFPNWTKKGNEAAHQGLFDGIYKTFNLSLKVDKVTFLRPDLAQVIVIGGGQEAGGTPPENPGVIMTIITEKKNDTWKIISFHNHEFNALEIKQRGIPLNVMFAAWYKK